MPLGNPHLCLEKENCCPASPPRLAGVFISPRWNVCVCARACANASPLFFFMYFLKVVMARLPRKLLNLGVDIWGLKKEFSAVDLIQSCKCI